jgi:hypothetical protein
MCGQNAVLIFVNPAGTPLTFKGLSHFNKHKTLSAGESLKALFPITYIYKKTDFYSYLIGVML